jgi:hypothetical protein
VTQGGGGGAAAGAGAGTGVGQLASTGGAPLVAETFLGAILTLIGAALLKPKEVLRRIIR